VRIAVITSGFPRTSETFALNELLALHRSGSLAAVLATKAGDGRARQPGAGELPVHVLAAGTVDEQAREAATLLGGAGVGGVHGYFAHEPARVARAAARRLGVPFGFSVHARDARKVERRELGERARAAACVVACNADAAAEVERAGGRARLVPHGVDLARFQPTPPPANGTLALLAVGRLVEKKGFHVLLDALRLLDEPVRLRVVGEGPERERLERAADGRTELAGALTHAELPAEYATADVVVVPSIEDSTGDRDGLPNVALEALASGRPVVASDVGAFAGAVRHGETGLLVPPGDPRALARALHRLLDPQVRAELGRRGRELVEREFELGRCTSRLHALLERAYA
jgi:colanic acid/amylovoran biosynthesis glycosyltransferase